MAMEASLRLRQSLQSHLLRRRYFQSRVYLVRSEEVYFFVKFVVLTVVQVWRGAMLHQ